MSGTPVEGTHGDGSAVTRNIPVLVGGVDGSGNVQTLLTDTGGAIQVDIQSAAVAGDVAAAATDSGNPVKIGGRADSTEPTAVTDGQRADAFFDLSGRLVTRQKSRTGTTPTQVADSASSVTLLAANENRLGAIFTNTSSAVLYIKLGATAATTSFAYRVAQYGTVELPAGYIGIVDGIWASDPGDGVCAVTELT